MNYASLVWRCSSNLAAAENYGAGALGGWFPVVRWGGGGRQLPGGGQGRGVVANLSSGTVGFLHSHPIWKCYCLL